MSDSSPSPHQEICWAHQGPCKSALKRKPSDFIVKGTYCQLRQICSSLKRSWALAVVHTSVQLGAKHYLNLLTTLIQPRQAFSVSFKPKHIPPQNPPYPTHNPRDSASLPPSCSLPYAPQGGWQQSNTGLQFNTPYEQKSRNLSTHNQVPSCVFPLRSLSKQ